MAASYGGLRNTAPEEVHTARIAAAQPLANQAEARPPDRLEAARRASGADDVEQDLAPVRAVAVLDEIEALPGAERRRGAGQHGAEWADMSSGPSVSCT